MSTDRRTATPKALIVGVVLVVLALVVVIGLLLIEHGPGNMGVGFLQGAGIGILGGIVLLWRVTRRPEKTTTFERAWTQSGDERDDAVLTRALAVLGLSAVPLSGAAAVAIGLGALVEMVLTLLLVAEILVGAIAFAVINRRS
jgi:hypothetical protein